MRVWLEVANWTFDKRAGQLTPELVAHLDTCSPCRRYRDFRKQDLGWGGIRVRIGGWGGFGFGANEHRSPWTIRANNATLCL